MILDIYHTGQQAAPLISATPLSLFLAKKPSTLSFADYHALGPLSIDDLINVVQDYPISRFQTGLKGGMENEKNYRETQECHRITA